MSSSPSPPSSPPPYSRHDSELDGLLDNEELDSMIKKSFLTPSYVRAQRRRAFFRLALVFFVIAVFIAAFIALFVNKIFGGNRAVTSPYESLSVEPYDSEKLLSNGTHQFAATVIVISFDGFRADYIDRGFTPNILQLGKQGILAKYMTPSFPTVTFPNHYSLVTGLYPESHGIVGNEFYDPVLNDTFTYKDPKHSWDPKWWGGEPIWVTSVLQKKPSAVLMWPGCSAIIRNSTPTYTVAYNSSVSLAEKVQTLLNWIDLPLGKRPQLLAAYVSDVDSAGHKGGPDSKGVNDALANVDEMVNQLLVGLAKRNLTDIINIVLVSDHGMTASSNTRLIYYDSILTPKAFAQIGTPEGWPLLLIRPTNPNSTTDICAQLLNHTRTVPSNYSVFLRENVPERFHFSASKRIPPIVAIPDLGYSFVTKQEFDVTKGKTYTPRGIHGYDNLAADMRSLFVARGPAFDGVMGSGKIVKPFKNVELYGVLAKVLGLKPAPNNGTLGGVLVAE